MKYLLVFSYFIFLSSCRPLQSSKTLSTTSNTSVFWSEMQKLCGQAYAGEVIAAPASDTTFKNKKLIMHIRACSDKIIRIPFTIGDDRSRTWVLQKADGNLSLKHDHRHQNGSEDAITKYGGVTSNSGTSQIQVFPADERTAQMLPAAAANVWWIELKGGDYFTYNLRRIGTDRLFTIKFNLKKPVDAPPAPWGWKD